MKAFNYLSAPIESVRDCFQKPLKGSIHNRGACTLSAAGRKTTIYLFTFEKANGYKFFPEINLPLSFFPCLLPHPFPNLSPHLVFIYLFSMKAAETAEEGTVMQKKEAQFVLMEMPAVLRQSRSSSHWFPAGLPREVMYSMELSLQMGHGTTYFNGCLPIGVSKQTFEIDGGPPTSQMRKVRLGS